MTVTLPMAPVQVRMSHIKELALYREQIPYEIWADNVKDGIQRTNIQLQIIDDIALTDVRTIKSENPNLHTHGFEYLHQEFPERCGINTADEISGNSNIVQKRIADYLDSMTELLRSTYGCSKTLCFDWRVRHVVGGIQPEAPNIYSLADAPDEEPRAAPINAAHIIHADGSPRWMKNMVANLLTDDERIELLRENYRIRAITVWRPLVAVVENEPLAVYDARTLDESDWEMVEKILDEAVEESMYLKRRDHHQWYWMKNQTRDEVLVLSVWDSAEPNNPRKCLHALYNDPDLALKAVYSRSETTAKAVASSAKIDAYFDLSHDTARSLDALLAREDIHAVVIALPTSVQSIYIKRAIEAGKHVLSQSPIAINVQAGEELIRWYDEGQRSRSLWSIGAKVRFMDEMMAGHNQLRKMEGRVLTFSLKLHRPIEANSDPDNMEERCSPERPEAINIEDGVLLFTALRFLLQAASETIVKVTAVNPQPRANEPDATINATMRLSNGNSGTCHIAVVPAISDAWEVEVVTENGAVTVRPTRATFQAQRDGESSVGISRAFKADNAASREVAVFAQGIKKGGIEARGEPVEALEDLRIFQAVLESLQDGGRVKLLG